MKQMTTEELKSYGETLPLGSTYDHNGSVLSFRGIDGYWSEYTRDAQGDALTFKNSTGDWFVYTRDAQGRDLTYKNSDGCWRGFSNEEIDKERARLKQVRKQLKRSKK